MSCCCQYECSCRSVTTTSTTTTTTLCPDAIFCDSVIDMDCVVYTGCDDDCLQIETGDSLTQVLVNIFEALNGCGQGSGTTTTTIDPGPQQLVEICLTYAADGGCAASCPLECGTYYVYQNCYTYITTNDAFNALECVIYLDAAGLTTAPNGWYSRPGGLCYILGFQGGEISGVTNCP
jgi:hypothetical protein